MRVTFAAQYRHGLENIETAADRLAEFQRQVSSGRRLDRVSDDPAAAVDQLVVDREAIFEDVARERERVGAIERRLHRTDERVKPSTRSSWRDPQSPCTARWGSHPTPPPFAGGAAVPDV